MKHYNFCSDKSFIQNGILHEYFGITHYDQFQVVNRAEQALVQHVIQLSSKPWTEGIEALRAHIAAQVMPTGYGKVIVHPVYTAGSIAGKPHWCERQFLISAGKRSIPTLIISETVMKDSERDYAYVPPEDLVFNRHLAITCAVVK